MSSATTTLTLEQFRSRYSNEKPGYEYWYGEAVQKSVPTWLHSLLQAILTEFLWRSDYISGPELELRISEDWQPKPDVVGATEVIGSYPTHAVDVVVEVLSPDDRMHDVFRKCREYVRIGTVAIFVLDPESRDGWEWSRETNNLERIAELRLPNGSVIAVDSIWEELDRRKARRSSTRIS